MKKLSSYSVKVLKKYVEVKSKEYGEEVSVKEMKKEDAVNWINEFHSHETVNIEYTVCVTCAVEKEYEQGCFSEGQYDRYVNICARLDEYKQTLRLVRLLDRLGEL